MEAASGVEPLIAGLASLPLISWVRRHRGITEAPELPRQRPMLERRNYSRRGRSFSTGRAEELEIRPLYHPNDSIRNAPTDIEIISTSRHYPAASASRGEVGRRRDDIDGFLSDGTADA